MAQRETPTGVTDTTPGGATLPPLEPGSNVLVRGPSLYGKRALSLELLSSLSATERPIVLAVATDATSVRRRLFEAGHADIAKDCYVVDAVRSQVSGGTVACTDGGGPGRTWYVTSPGNLTGIGMATSRAMEAAFEEGGRPRLVIDSLSTLLQYNSLERIYRFLHVLNGRVTSLGGTTIQIVHSDAHDIQSVATLGHLFDSIFDVTDGANGGELTVRNRNTTNGGTFSMETVQPAPAERVD